MTDVSVTDVNRHFSDYLNRAAYGGESFVLIRGGKPVAELRPFARPKTVSDLPGIFASMPGLSDAEMKNFASDIKKARKNKMEKSPWDA
jgi:antitoxin (DNA-binding transcriptional repressor) of toxin-antitoxin stability system